MSFEPPNPNGGMPPQMMGPPGTRPIDRTQVPWAPKPFFFSLEPMQIRFNHPDGESETKDYVIMEIHTDQGMQVYWFEPKVGIDFANSIKRVCRETLTKIARPTPSIWTPGGEVVSHEEAPDDDEENAGPDEAPLPPSTMHDRGPTQDVGMPTPLVPAADSFEVGGVEKLSPGAGDPDGPKRGLHGHDEEGE